MPKPPKETKPVGKLYQSPLRVYLLLGCLALIGIYCGLKLPVSLFPNSTKPVVWVEVNYGFMTSDEFLNTYGYTFEERLKGITFENHQVEKVEARYGSRDVDYTVRFKWGAPPTEAVKEVQTVANAFASQFPQEIRDSLRVDMWSENSGFLAISFFSERRSLDDLYRFLEPIVTPAASKVQDASGVGLWNPTAKEISLELDPDKMASLQLVPADIERAIGPALSSSNAGSVSVGLKKLDVTLPRYVGRFEELSQILITSPTGRVVHLGDIAKIDFGTPLGESRVMKTSGAPSLILFANPKPGGNVKRMAEEIISIVEGLKPQFPPDVQYKVLVDPSEFIRAATNNVLHEVFLAAILAVCVLFLFIGNFKNVMTAAIEIPFSIVLAFILMRLTGMNMNLISLGGLALSAGMNVDASVVVMENIFRHFEQEKGKALTHAQRVQVLMRAVREVQFPIIASTIASLVVFIPLAFTSALTNAILGDLALAVVFSHGFSAVVALILVPTVRLHLMSKFGNADGHSPIERQLRALESGYAWALRKFLDRRKVRNMTYGAITAVLAVLIALVLPKLPKEIIGTPDTDWMYLGINTEGNTLVKQMESQAEEIEDRMLRKFGDKILYTFTQVQGPNNSSVMARLRDKRDSAQVWKDMEKEFENTPVLRFYVFPWNPSELPIPDPDDLQVVIRGENAKARALAAQDLRDVLQQKRIFPDVWTKPSVDRKESVFLRPNMEQWMLAKREGLRLDPAELADLARVATTGKQVGHLMLDGQLTKVNMRFPEDRIQSIEDLEALPVGVAGRLIPLRALAHTVTEEVEPTNYRIDGRGQYQLNARMKKEDRHKADEAAAQAAQAVQEWVKGRPLNDEVVVTVEDSKIELTDALNQLAIAVALSVLLIFLTMVFQFGDVVNALLVLVAVPLGFIGVLASLYLFNSTLSLNSVLGVILLNGIAVANSIILVDFLKRLVEGGLAPREAAVQAARQRMRPILMTSLTTALGMLPVAIGMGEGGRILQPLGIAVIGGLWFSMAMTLFLVPALQVSYLEWRGRREADRQAGRDIDSMIREFESDLDERAPNRAPAVTEVTQ
ncbi:MAG TPA: efflux RND transporter permease subunit [Bdellovibrionales bacterium]|nr:efflux RND transporter permease subunit [Bdellovibrionales bacterium]